MLRKSGPAIATVTICALAALLPATASATPRQCRPNLHTSVSVADIKYLVVFVDGGANCHFARRHVKPLIEGALCPRGWRFGGLPFTALGECRRRHQRFWTFGAPGRRPSVSIAGV